MKRGDEVLREWSGPGAIRTRVLWRGTATTRRVWTEFTNQPGDDDWFHGSEVYWLSPAPKGNTNVVMGHGYNQAPLSPVTLDRLVRDLLVVGAASQRRYRQRARTRASAAGGDQ